MAATVLRKVQFGDEGTAGTATAATTVMGWPAGATLNDERTITLVDEAVGQAVPFGRQYQPAMMAVMEVPDVAATFEQIGYWFEAGLERIGTAGSDTGGSGHIYQYDQANASAPTIRTYTIEGQSGQQEREMYYSFVEEMTISGASDEAWMVSGRWRGRTATDGTMTAAQTRPTNLEEILFNRTQFYVDAATGTIGTTAKTETLLGFSVTIPTGQVAITAADSTTNQFSTVAWQPAPSPDGGITGELTVRHNTNGEALYDGAVAGTVFGVRIQATGATLTTAGSSYSTKIARLDMAVEFTDVPNLEEQDGGDIYTLPFRVVDSAVCDHLTVLIVNELAALP